MPKLSLNKTIEARKLNQRTGVPTSGPAVTIPFGAIIDNVDMEGDTRKFTYSGELYRVAEDTLLSALDRSVRTADANARSVAVPAAASTATPALDARMRWEELSSTHQRVLRAKVPGGWLVAIEAAGLAFYPDPDHVWDGSAPL